MKADTVIYNIGTLLNPVESKIPLKGKRMDQVETYHDAFIAIKDDYVLALGTTDYLSWVDEDTTLIDAKGKLATPGLIDSHTHVVHAGSREYEFEQKMKGVPYLDILKAGGGILSTVKSTREASDIELYHQAKKSLIRMIKYGVTTVEGKSGYGLNHETELKQLNVQKKLAKDLPIEIVSTYMGAHALPSEYKDDKQTYLDRVIELMPTIKKENLATFVDIFCEDGAFDVYDSKKVLSAAKNHGFKVKIHADEINALGGVPLAVSLEATSADHLMAIDEAGMNALANSNTIATLLPSTSFYLNSDYAPARTLINRNIAIALASDYNPGSSPSENFMFTLNLAAIHLKMSPNEILNAATLNAAYALDKQSDVGRLEKGKKANLVLYDAPNWPYVLYHYATNHISDVFLQGQHIVNNTKYREEK